MPPLRWFSDQAFTESTAPATPAAGLLVVYANSTDHRLHAKDSTGRDQQVAKSAAQRVIARNTFR